jgi:hypothetical protein
MFDVDTEAAIRHIDMEGDQPTLGQAGPADTNIAYNSMDFETKPGR